MTISQTLINKFHGVKFFWKTWLLHCWSKDLPCIEPKGSSPCSQETASGFYPHPAESSHNLTPCFFNIQLNIILLSMFRSSKTSLPFKFPDQNAVRTSYLPSVCLCPISCITLFDFMLLISDAQYQLQSSSLCNSSIFLLLCLSLTSKHSLQYSVFKDILQNLLKSLGRSWRDCLGSYLVALVTYIIGISVHGITGWIIMKSCTRACDCFHLVQPFIF